MDRVRETRWYSLIRGHGAAFLTGADALALEHFCAYVFKGQMSHLPSGVQWLRVQLCLGQNIAKYSRPWWPRISQD